ncbi:hypothetical protein SynROS8604_01514 [Synechococcus sp. ROS8604]|nr:hypothetical protein SynROS8604_01514 [Synechococcus sp. ROS8604]
MLGFWAFGIEQQEREMAVAALLAGVLRRDCLSAAPFVHAAKHARSLVLPHREHRAQLCLL